MEFNLEQFESELAFKSPTQIKSFRRFFLNFCYRGLSLFLNQRLHKLDPHVGDTACQLRACHFIFLSLDLHKNHRKKYYENIQSFLKNWLKHLKTGHSTFESNKGADSNHLLPDGGGQGGGGKTLNLKGEGYILSEETFLFGLSYFLSHFRIPDEVGGSKAINFRRIASRFKISNNFANRLIRVAQRELSRISCEFILNLSLKIEYPYHDLLLKLLKIGDDDRSLLPCFFSSDVIWRYLKKEKIPLCFEVRNENNSSERTHIIFHEENLRLKPCFYMVCKTQKLRNSQQIRQYIKENFEDVFYVSIAMHPQYAGLKYRRFKEDPFQSLDAKDYKTYQRATLILKGYQSQLDALKQCAIFHIKTKFLTAPFIINGPQTTLEVFTKEKSYAF